MQNRSDHSRSTDRALARLAVLLVTTAIVWTLVPVPAAASYPDHTDLYVNDFAGVLTAADAERLREPLMRLRTDHGIEATVVTVPSFRDYGTGDTTIETFATGLFNTWGIGHRERDDGALILLAVQDRGVRIELGDGYGRAHDVRMKQIIDDHMIPKLRSGNLARGLLAGTLELEKALTDIRPLEDRRTEDTSTSSAPTASSQLLRPESGIGTSTGTPGTVSRFVHRLGGWFYGILAGLVGMAGAGFGAFFRYRPRRCPQCQGPMERLDEQSDDEYLDTGQQAEETLRSVDYDVWRCTVCKEHTTKPYRRWLTRSSNCESCGYRTVRKSSKVLRHATYTSTGEHEVTRQCHHCDWSKVTRETVPMRTRSSSSSSSGGSSGGSSFGGGSSSGGGASGSW